MQSKKLVLQKRILEIELNGEVVSLSYPNMQQLEEFVEALIKGDKDYYTVYREFLELLGMPNKFFKLLDPVHLKQIADTLRDFEEKKS